MRTRKLRPLLGEPDEHQKQPKAQEKMLTVTDRAEKEKEVFRAALSALGGTGDCLLRASWDEDEPRKGPPPTSRTTMLPVNRPIHFSFLIFLGIGLLSMNPSRFAEGTSSAHLWSHTSSTFCPRHKRPPLSHERHLSIQYSGIPPRSLSHETRHDPDPARPAGRARRRRRVHRPPRHRPRPAPVQRRRRCSPPHRRSAKPPATPRRAKALSSTRPTR